MDVKERGSRAPVKMVALGGWKEEETEKKEASYSEHFLKGSEKTGDACEEHLGWRTDK